ncbi:uncharacterized protein DEA37_0001502 [Paragonimus westermani]|uniref:DPY30 domain-containing protein 2 n=1 Tax=Paragonimus westermani TaxID=34504 RepID=A0A5J4NMD9_9TREM|nr:uncharacterized protein DEA37_0001502 [Paragonimus westermani]
MSDELEGTYGQETQYLMATLGPILRVYVAKLVAKRPHDPIEYLGQCLKHHAYLDRLEKEEEASQRLELEQSDNDQRLEPIIGAALQKLDGLREPSESKPLTDEETRAYTSHPEQENDYDQQEKNTTSSKPINVNEEDADLGDVLQVTDSLEDDGTVAEDSMERDDDQPMEGLKSDSEGDIENENQLSITDPNVDESEELQSTEILSKFLTTSLPYKLSLEYE